LAFSLLCRRVQGAARRKLSSWESVASQACEYAPREIPLFRDTAFCYSPSLCCISALAEICILTYFFALFHRCCASFTHRIRRRHGIRSLRLSDLIQVVSLLKLQHPNRPGPYLSASQEIGGPSVVHKPASFYSPQPHTKTNERIFVHKDGFQSVVSQLLSFLSLFPTSKAYLLVSF
jgi:hypothetical protein